MKNLSILLISAGFIIFYALLSNLAYGKDGGAFLRRGLDGRALAIGGAFTSVTDGASSVYWNPAGLTGVDNYEFTSMFSTLSLDRSEIFAAFAHTFSQYLSVGAGWYKFGVSNIDGRDINGMRTQLFDDNENCFMFSCASEYNIENIGRISAGITGKYIHQSLLDNKGTGFGFDFGLQATAMEFIRIGLVLQDIGTGISWNTNNNTKDNAPITMRVGASVYPGFFPMFFSIEGVRVFDNFTKFKTGIGAKLIENFGLKVGYNGDDPTMGAFFFYPVGGMFFQVDYAATRDILENGYVHHVTLAIRF